MSTRLEKIKAYYASFDEWARLESPDGAIEFKHTLNIVASKLRPESRILDLGGGPGRYAAELVRQGHRVVLADLSPELLSFAKTKLGELGLESGMESYDEVDAIDLSVYEAESFDAVLAAGPFYHLTTIEERAQATLEILRVLKPGGYAFIVYIPKASGLKGLVERAVASPEQVNADVLKLASETGVFQNASEFGFQEGYFAAPGEIRRMMELAKFEIDDELSLKSVAEGLGNAIGSLEHPVDALDAPAANAVNHLIVSMCREPEVINACGHAMVVARKP